MNDKTIIKNMLIDFLEKLNNGNRFSREDIERDYAKIQQFIDPLYTVDNFPVNDEDDNVYCFIDTKRKHFDKYHIQSIAEAIMDYKTNDSYKNDIEYIIKDSKLPRRDDEAYQIISSYEPYELTHCISYEMAIRNEEVIAFLKNIKSLTLLSKRLLEYYISFGNIEIEKNPYLDFEKVVTESLELLGHYKITQNPEIKFKHYKPLEANILITEIIIHLIMILEEENKGNKMFFDEDNNTVDKKYYADYLLAKYGKLGLTRQETADELGISLSFLDKLLREGTGLPTYRKIGKSQKPRIVFPVDAIADFMVLDTN